FFSSRRRHTRFDCDWSSDVCSSDLMTTTSKKVQQQEPVPDFNWSEMSTSQHFVQFYETDDFLLNSLSEFIGMGLAEGDACIVIEIGRASCRERGWIWVVGRAVKKEW